MMLRTQYIDHFCLRCLRDVGHTKLIYMDQTVITCTFCQESTTVKEVKSEMKRTYTIVSIDEKDRNSTRRHMIVAEIQRKSEPDSPRDVEGGYDTLMVQYPAHGDRHFTSSVVKYPSGDVLNHIESKAIAKAIKEFLGIGD